MATPNLLSSFIKSGRLILSQNPNKLDFGIYNQQLTTFSSISNFLDEIHNSPTPYIKLHIKQTANNHTLNLTGFLHKAYDSDDIFSYHITYEHNQFPLDKQLFEMTGLDMFVSIQHLSDLEGYLDEAK
jgi:hypothetical protein